MFAPVLSGVKKTTVKTARPGQGKIDLASDPELW